MACICRRKSALIGDWACFFHVGQSVVSAIASFTPTWRFALWGEVTLAKAQHAQTGCFYDAYPFFHTLFVESRADLEFVVTRTLATQTCPQICTFVDGSKSRWLSRCCCLGVWRPCWSVAGCESSSAGIESTTHWGVVHSAAIEARGAASEASEGRGVSTTTWIVRRLFHHVFGGNHAPDEGYIGALMSSDTHIGA